MRNSCNVFSGGRKRQGRMRFSPCQLLRGSSFSSEAGGESSLECGVAAQASRIQESESRIGKGLAKSHPHKAPCDVSGSEMTRRTLGHGAPQCLTVAYFIPNSGF
jgi:hypothetical protein